MQKRYQLDCGENREHNCNERYFNICLILDSATDDALCTGWDYLCWWTFPQGIQPMPSNLIPMNSKKFEFWNFDYIIRRSNAESDKPVQLRLSLTMFTLLCVKVLISWNRFFSEIRRWPQFFRFQTDFYCESDDIVEIPKFKLFRIHRNKVWI